VAKSRSLGRHARRCWNNSGISSPQRQIVEAFRAVGVSRPVELSQEQKGLLIEVIEHWATQVRFGLEGLPEGLRELRNALHDDLHDSLSQASGGRRGDEHPGALKPRDCPPPEQPYWAVGIAAGGRKGQEQVAPVSQQVCGHLACWRTWKTPWLVSPNSFSRAREYQIEGRSIPMVPTSHGIDHPIPRKRGATRGPPPRPRDLLGAITPQRQGRRAHCCAQTRRIAVPGFLAQPCGSAGAR
jgi:hypothetical protein